MRVVVRDLNRPSMYYKRFDFLFQFHGIKSPFYPYIYAGAHSLSLSLVRAHTANIINAIQCVLNKFASRLNNIYHLLKRREREKNVNESVFVCVCVREQHLLRTK